MDDVTDVTQPLVGDVAYAEWVPRLESVDPTHRVGLSAWVVTFHPGDAQYLVGVNHLRPVTSDDPPAERLTYGIASHELVVFHLNPFLRYPGTIRPLIPGIVWEQFLARSDTHAVEVVWHMVNSVVCGDLPLHPRLYPTDVEHWSQMLTCTAQHPFHGHSPN